MRERRVRRIAVRVLRKLGVVGGVLLAAGLGIGAAYQAIGVRVDRRAFPSPGDLMSIGTHRLHIRCVGSGESTLLLDAGAGGWSMHWFMYEASLAERARVCSFDRSGLGWSEEGPGAYHGEAMSRELHALLVAAGVEVPVVYVGHSLGANLAQIHYRLFPQDVSGLVLIDPGRPADMLEDFEGSRDEALAIDRCGWKCALASVATRVGVVRFATRKAGRNTLGEERQRAYHAGMSRQSAVKTVLSYLEYLPRTAYQNLEPTDYGDVPLTVVYSGDTREPEGDETEANVAEWHRAVLEDMAELAGRSTRGRGPVVVPGATHQSIVTHETHVSRVLAEIKGILDLVEADG